MKLSVTVFGHLRNKISSHQNGMIHLELPEKSTVEHALSKLNINTEKSIIVLINDAPHSMETVLKDEDQITVLPIAAGG